MKERSIILQVDKLCLKLIECVQSGLYKNQLLTGGRIQDLLSDTSNSQRPSRAASINPKQNKNQNDTLRRKIILDENSRAKKIRKTAKTTKHELENLVTFTSLRDSPDVKKSMVMVSARLEVHVTFFCSTVQLVYKDQPKKCSVLMDIFSLYSCL